MNQSPRKIYHNQNIVQSYDKIPMRFSNIIHLHSAFGNRTMNKESDCIIYNQIFGYDSHLNTESILSKESNNMKID